MKTAFDIYVVDHKHKFLKTFFYFQEVTRDPEIRHNRISSGEFLIDR